MAVIIVENKPQNECMYNEYGFWNILKKYFSNTATITLNVVYAPDALNIAEDFLINFQYKDDRSAIKLHVHKNMRIKSEDTKFHESNIGHIFAITNRENLTNIFRSKIIFTSRTPFFIFYFTRNQSCTDVENDINEVLIDSWRYYILNLLINTPCSCEKNKIYSFESLHNTIKKMEIIQLLTHADEIWDDLHDFKGYPIRVSMFERIPTAVKNPRYLNYGQENLRLSRGYGGLDGLTLENLAIYLNFTPIVFEPIADDFGQRLENGTYSGSLGDIVYARADFAGNARFIKNYNTNKIEFTRIVSNELLCLIVPKSRRIPQWTMIFHSFSLYTKLVIFLIFISVTFIWYLLDRLQSHYIIENSQKNHSPFLVILSNMFFIPQRVKTNSSSKKILLAACMLLNVILMGIFQGSLATSFSITSYYKEISTLEQFLETDMLISTDLNIFTSNDSTVQEMLRRRLMSPFIPHTSLDRAAYNRDVAAVERKSDADFLLQTKYLNADGFSLLHVVEQCPKSYPLSYIVPKGFPFLEKFNSAIEKFSRAGLLDKWYLDFINNIIMKKKYELNIISIANPSALNRDDLQTAFYLLIIGIGTSVLIFICECVAHKLKQNATSRNSRQICII